MKALTNLPRCIGNDRCFWRWSRVDGFEGSWQRVVSRSGIQDFRFHDLRHEATSRLFEKDLNMMEVATITGHKTLQMLKRYTHLKAENLLEKIG
jgi:integrase